MKRLFGLVLVLGLVILSCKKNEESTPTTGNISSQVVSNLANVTASFAPTSMTSVTTSSLSQHSDICASVDWGTCQSLLVREYVKIGRSAVQSVSDVVAFFGNALGGVPDGNAGTSSDGKVSWSKTDSSNWSLLARGANSASQLFVRVAGNVYTLQIDGTVAETNPDTFKAEATVTYVSQDTWTVDVYIINTTCDTTDVGAPSRVNIKLSKANGLWTGKTMAYAPRWYRKPNTSVSCSTAEGVHDIAFYTDFVGNNTATKASVYLTPGSTSTFVSQSSSFEMVDFCTTFSGLCDVTGGPNSASLTQANFGNPFCSTNPAAAPTWNNACTFESTVNAASYSAASEWIEPNALKSKSVTLPTAL